MKRRQDLDATIRIPVITDLVKPGDVEAIRVAKQGLTEDQLQSFERHLKSHIEELRSATGQDEYTGMARAHAIRSENPLKDEPTRSQDFESEIDQRRIELFGGIAKK